MAQLGPPIVPFLTPFFGWEGSPTKIDYSKKLVPTYSSLSTGGPKTKPFFSIGFANVAFFELG